MVVASMGANLYRYGRFELSNSMGRHLWNVVSVRSDAMLAESREYRILKQSVPDVQGKYWWEIDPQKVDGLKTFTREELFRTLSAQAIGGYPLSFAAIGFRNTVWLLRNAPHRIGFSRALYYNPLNRTTMLPPIVRASSTLERFLAGFHRAAAGIYKYAVYGALALGAIATVARAVFSSRREGRELALMGGVWTFLAGVFLAMSYFSGQIERPDARYGIPHLPLLMMMSSTAIAMLPEVWAKRTLEDRSACGFIRNGRNAAQGKEGTASSTS
jgi:hypothetical protein